MSKCIDSIKMAWFRFARSRNWNAKIKLSDGAEITGSRQTGEDK